MADAAPVKVTAEQLGISEGCVPRALDAERAAACTAAFCALGTRRAAAPLAEPPPPPRAGPPS